MIFHYLTNVKFTDSLFDKIFILKKLYFYILFNYTIICDFLTEENQTLSLKKLTIPFRYEGSL